MAAQITPICALLFGIAAGQVADSEAGPTVGTDQTDEQPADPGDEFPAIDWRDDQDAESDLKPMDPADTDQTDPGPPPRPTGSHPGPPPIRMAKTIVPVRPRSSPDNAGPVSTSLGRSTSFPR